MPIYSTLFYINIFHTSHQNPQPRYCRIHHPNRRYRAHRDPASSTSSLWRQGSFYAMFLRAATAIQVWRRGANSVSRMCRMSLCRRRLLSGERAVFRGLLLRLVWLRTKRRSWRARSRPSRTQSKNSCTESLFSTLNERSWLAQASDMIMIEWYSHMYLLLLVTMRDSSFAVKVRGKIEIVRASKKCQVPHLTAR